MKNKILSIILLLLFTTIINAQVPERPKKARLVNDYVGILNANEVAQLEQKLVKFNNSTSTQIVIVIVDDLNGQDKSMFAYEIGEKWGVGQKKFNNGVVILVKPTGGQGERKTFIAVGYGLEPVIPDAIAKRIVEKELLPYFRNNDFYGGLDKATNVIMKLAMKEFTPDEYIEKTKTKPITYFPIIFVILFFIIFRAISVRSYSRSNSIPFWTALFLMSSMGGHGGSYGSFSSGSGGFGGFGGGGFGGGGAGGSW
ncbi:MAG: TPM domain-containing protein [Bacteroidota bacterium]|nr:TPM domain-containing protein [Bacteroidota bacterium]